MQRSIASLVSIRALSLVISALGGLAATAGDVAAQTPQRLNENCIVSVLNRNTRVRPDGTWVLPNIPANFGLVRARATCVFDGLTVSGESAPFLVLSNASVNVPSIVLGSTTPIPTGLQLTATPAELTTIGQTSQVNVQATYSDGTTRNVTAASTGTLYVISNPSIAALTADGLVSGLASGTALIQGTNEGTSGFTSIRVVLTQDSDGDGISDDLELRLGLNPNNAADALEDRDHDGLSNRDEANAGTDLNNPDTDGDGILDGEEVRLGADGFITNPLLADTDGDGIRDGLEVATGSDPTNPASVNLNGALNALLVSPDIFTITINSVQGEGFRQLTVTGVLKDGNRIDLTSTAKGTNYQSSNLNICNFGLQDGRVFGGQTGDCTITITNGGHTTHATGAVTNFTPVALSFVAIPGFANNVDVSGSYAYVAAGAAGLQVVNVSNRTAPVVVASLDTPGNANDVRVLGNIAYVADGTSGLQIINIANPLAPQLIGSIDTPGDAWDVVVSNNRAYVADGAAGLRIIDVTNPAVPTLLGSIDPPGTQKGVDVDPLRNLAVLASGDQGLHVIDVSNPTAPVLRGALPGGDVRDVALQNNHAFLADNTRSFTSVDLTDPAIPILRNSVASNLGGRLNDVVVQGNFGLGADVLFVNGVPIIAVDAPDNPVSRAILNFSTLGDSDGQGIAADAGYVYLAAVGGSAFTENGTTSNASRLYIGQYMAIEDRGGIAPTVSIVQPLQGATVVEGSQVPVRVNATDDIAVASVTFLSNGNPVFTDSSEPYEAVITAPAAPGPLVVGARAIDFGNNIGTTSLSLQVIPDPLTTIVGTIVRQGGGSISGATVTCGAQGTTSGAGGAFTIVGAPTLAGFVTCNATFLDGTTTLRGSSARTPIVLAGTTNVGAITMRAGARVLLISDAATAGVNSLVQALTAAGNQVTLRPPPEYTWDNTNPSLVGFECVIHLNGATPFNGFPAAAQQAMVDYVRGGGCYIISGWMAYEAQSGISPLMADFAFINYQGGLGSGQATYTKLKDHPVLEGLPNSFSIATEGDDAGPVLVYGTDPVEKIAVSSTCGSGGCPNSTAGIFVRPLGAGRAIKFSFMAHYAGQSGNVLTDPNVQRLFVNAVRWGTER